jgi:prepilin-type N-terminal cleavage/methylation domain-containing protein
MVFSSTSIKSRKRRNGFTLVELLVAVAIASMVLTVAMALYIYSARSFAALANYADLDSYSRNTLDVITQEIRQADRLVSGDSQSMTFQFTDPLVPGSSWQVTYIYSPTARTLSRIRGASREVLLRECDFLNFAYFQRNPISGTYDQYPTAVPATCKLVQMSWICSRSIMQQSVNTESVQSAKVVIRKQ